MIFCAITAEATHIVGGELYYTWLGNDQYLITLKVYRDCGPGNTNNTQFDEQAPIGIFNSNGSLLEVLNMNLFSAEVNFVPVSLNNPCFVLPPNVCVEEAIYTETIELPQIPNGYILAYQRCCRNPGIINIEFPQDMGVTFTTQIPGTNLTTAANSCPQFNFLPPVALCQGAEFFFDHSATDIDGDSLVYEYCTPLHGASADNPAPLQPSAPPYTEVTWSPGYDPSYPIDSSPPITINSQTGWIEGTASQLGKYVIGVCVSEYRNGVLLSTTNRDFQFNVTTCDPNILSGLPEQEEYCTGLTLAFGNNSVNATFWHWDFGVPGTDADTSNVENPSFTFPEAGMYSVMLVANPGWPCADTSEAFFEVIPFIDPEIVLENFECVNNVELYSFSVNSTASPQATYSWDFGPGSVPLTSTDQSPEGIHLNQEDDTMEINLTVTDGLCVDETSLIVDNPPDPIASIVPQDSFCEGLTYQFYEDCENTTEYHWDFGSGGLPDLTDTQSPLWTFGDTGVYHITLVAISEFNCDDTADLYFEIYGFLNPFFDTPGPQCLDGNSFNFLAEGATTDEATFNWNFGGNSSPLTSLASQPQNIQYNAADMYNVELTISENGCTESYSDSIWVVQNPVVDFLISETEGCPVLIVGFEDLSTAETTIGYNWDFGDGTTSSAQNPVHYYTESGTYPVTLTINTNYGCIQTLSMTYPIPVSVYPLPIPGFEVDPGEVDILTPTVNVTSTAENATSVEYFMSDGGYSDQWDFTYNWTQSGKQSILQIVSNEYGCVATAEGYVLINGHLFWVPNAFTPNGDGINDYWQPVYTGVTNYHLQIFNRWGALIHESTDPSKAWSGNVNGSDHFAEDGIYQYIISFDDLLSFPHEAQGHVVLTR
jgi:gliding motility-associated-like protein